MTYVNFLPRVRTETAKKDVKTGFIPAVDVVEKGELHLQACRQAQRELVQTHHQTQRRVDPRHGGVEIVGGRAGPYGCLTRLCGRAQRHDECRQCVQR